MCVCPNCSIETQTEKAFQRQPTINLNRKVTKQVAKKKLRLSREIGLGFKTPREVCVCDDARRQGCRFGGMLL